MNPIKTMIVDDERLSRKRLQRLLSQDPDLSVVGEFENPQQALPAIEEQAPDLLFLDIQMPALDGFGLLETIGPDNIPCAIFVTAYEDYALRAFEVHAFDYLLKPFPEARLNDTVRRVKAHLSQGRLDPSASDVRQMLDSYPRPSRYRDRIAIRTGEKLILIRAEQIDWIEAADNYASVHCGHETHIVRETMNALERSLNPATFLRIHRSAIVNLDRIKSLSPWFRGDYRVHLSTGAELTLSRTYRHNLENRFMRL